MFIGKKITNTNNDDLGVILLNGRFSSPETVWMM